jgi:serine/threonine-protein kinase RsbW
VTAHAATDGDPVVVLEVPADVSYVGVVRSLAAGLAARLPFTVDEIDDLRIAVDEAFALLIPFAVADSVARTTFAVGADAIEVAVDVDARPGAALDQSGFGWTVLEALAHVAHVRDSDGGLGLTLHKDAEEAAAVGLTGTAAPLVDVSEPAAP